MNILITGCAGYIGSVLSQKLCSYPNYEVIGIDNLYYNNICGIQHLLGYKNFKFYRVDVRELPNTIIKQADIIIWLAAIVGAPACQRKPKESYEINVSSIKNLKVSKSQRIISPCTNSGYGQSGNLLCDENSPIEPVSSYGRQKVEAEKIILDHPNSVSLRLATVAGVSPRMRRDLLINDFVAKLYYQRELVLYEPHFRRNAVHIRDVCRAFMWMLDPLHKGIFNVGHDDFNLTKLRFAEIIQSKLGYGEIKIGDGKDEDQRDYLVSNNKILHTGFRFQYGLDETINEVITLYKCLPYEKTLSMSNI